MIKLNTFFGNHLKIDSECDIFEFSLTWSALQKKSKSTFNEDMQRNDCVRASLALFLDCKFTQCISVGGNNVPGETGEGRKESVCVDATEVCLVRSVTWQQPCSHKLNESQHHAQSFMHNTARSFLKTTRWILNIISNVSFFVMVMIWISRPCWCVFTLIIRERQPDYHHPESSQLHPAAVSNEPNLIKD